MGLGVKRGHQKCKSNKKWSLKTFFDIHYTPFRITLSLYQYLRSRHIHTYIGIHCWLLLTILPLKIFRTHGKPQPVTEAIDITIHVIEDHVPRLYPLFKGIAQTLRKLGDPADAVEFSQEVKRFPDVHATQVKHFGRRKEEGSDLRLVLKILQVL